MKYSGDVGGNCREISSRETGTERDVDGEAEAQQGCRQEGGAPGRAGETGAAVQVEGAPRHRYFRRHGMEVSIGYR